MVRVPEMVVCRKGKGTYRISSETQEGTSYRVLEKKGVWLCTCPFFTNRHSIETCKHIERVREAVYNDDFTDETEVGKLRTELTALIQKAYDIDRRLRNLEEGRGPSSGT